MNLRRLLACIAGRLTILAIMMLGTSPAHASLVGQIVEGDFFLNGGPTNLFDPTLQPSHVPPGFGNSLNPPGTGDTTVPISDSLVEFAYQGAVDLFTVNFTGTGDVTVFASGVPPTFTSVAMRFTSPGFTGLQLVPVNVVGTNNSCSSVITTINCTVTAGPGPGFTSTYRLVSSTQVPAPASLTLLALGLAGIIACCRNRKD